MIEGIIIYISKHLVLCTGITGGALGMFFLVNGGIFDEHIAILKSIGTALTRKENK